MDTNGQPLDTPVPTPTPNIARKLAILTFLLLLIPVLAATLVFPLLAQLPFQTPAEIEPDQIQWMSIRLLNRGQLDGGNDVDLFYAAPEDYSALLAPLKAVPEVPAFTEARGPWLGEYRIMRKDGRRATIRLYWHRNPHDPATVPAKLRFQLGKHWFEGGSAADVISIAESAQVRGRTSR